MSGSGWNQDDADNLHAIAFHLKRLADLQEKHLEVLIAAEARSAKVEELEARQSTRLERRLELMTHSPPEENG